MKQKIYPWVVVLCCCGLSTAAIGLSINCAGVFYNPIAESLNIGIGDVALYLTILNITSGLLGPYTVKLTEKINLRILVLCGVSVAAVCYIGMAMVSQMWQIYLLAFVLGVCNSFFGLVIVTLIIGNWFQKKMGIAQGISLSFSGLIGAIMSPVFSGIIEKVGWRTAYFYVALLVFMTVTPALVFIRLKPEELGMQPYGMNRENKRNAESDDAKKPESKTDRNHVTVLFLLCFITFAGAFIAGIGSHMAGYGTHIGLTVQSGAYLISMVMVGNTSSKMLAGVMCDTIGPKKTCLLTFAMNGAGMLLLQYIPAEHVSILMIGAILLGTSYSVSGVILSTMTKQIYGEARFGSVYSYTTIVGFISSAISYAIIGYSFDLFGSYTPAIAGCVMLAVLGAGCTLAVYRKQE